MKQILIIISLMIGNFSVNAQHCWENINTETTDWRETNSNNTWNWTQEFFSDLYINLRSNPVTVVSPFWTPQSTTSQNKVLFDFQKFKQANKKDFHPEDGWELIARNFGEVGAGKTTPYPFFALYNKYSGKIRAFMLVPIRPGESKTGSLMRATFNVGGRKTALYQHLKPIAQPIVNFETTEVDLPNDYNNAGDYWLFTEFTAAYDPCTCVDLNNVPQESRIIFEYFMVDKSLIKATMSGSLVEQVTSGSKPSTGNPSFALKDLDDAKKLVAAGQKGYKEWEGYIPTYNKILNHFTDSMYRDRLWSSIDTFRSTNPDFYKGIYDDIFTDNNVTREDFMDGTAWIDPEGVMKGTKTDFLDQNYSTIKGLASYIPYVGMAIGVIDLLVSEGDTKSSSAPKGPTVYEANLVMDGSIEKISTTGSNEVFTPGFTTDSKQFNFIPTYNNILGVFNVLELPDFEYYDIKPSVTNITANGLSLDLRNLCEENFSNLNNFDGANEVIFKQYRPTGGLNYVVNPNSELEVVSVEAALVLRYEGKDNLFLSRPRNFAGTKAIPYYNSISTSDRSDTLFHLGWSNDSSFNLSPRNGNRENQDGRLFAKGTQIGSLRQIDQKGRASVKRITEIENSTNLKLDFASSNYPNVDSSTISFRTDYLPVTCFDKLNFMVLGNNNFGEVYTKVYIRLKHKTDPNVKPITMVLSYDITPKLIAAKKNSTEGSYNSRIWGKNWKEQTRCCRKCEGAITFKSGEVSEYFYQGNFGLTSTPYAPNFFKEHNATYAGETVLEVMGSLNIPDNSVVPTNSLITAAGKITFGTNVSIGTDSKFYSGVSIDLSKVSSFNPNVEFDIRDINSMKYSCTNYNYTDNQLSNDSILSFCTSPKYRARTVLNKRDPNYNSDTAVNIIPEYLNLKVYPNPTSGQYRIEFNKIVKDISIEVMDLNGKTVQTEYFNGENNTLNLDASILQAGVYFLNIRTTDGQIGRERLVKY